VIVPVGRVEIGLHQLISAADGARSAAVDVSLAGHRLRTTPVLTESSRPHGRDLRTALTP
jgi:hypothetical protein